MDKWLFAVLVIEVFQRNVWPEDDVMVARLQPYVLQMRADYESKKWDVGFMEAARAAQVALLKKIESEVF